MPLLRALLLAGLLPLALASPALAQTPVDWYTDTGGGGALAQPANESKNGGAAAPVAPEPPIEPPAQTPTPPPIPVPARASEAPAAAAAPSERGGSRPAAAPAQAAEPVAAAAQADSGALEGALPFTGLQLAGMFGAGLLLVLGGAALWPRPARR